MAKTRIVFALYPGVTHLDFTGPHQVLVRTPESEVVAASLGGIDIEAEGLTFSNLADLAAIDRCDVLCIPGGFGTTAAIHDEAFMAQIRRLGAGATYLTSVCTGSLILGAAGFLRGRRAATHWAWRGELPAFGATVGEERVVRDGNVITGGGVTAGIDFALVLLEELAGRDYAEAIQLGLEYAPAPPFESGRPELARPEVLQVVQSRMAAGGAARAAATAEAAAKLARA
ncbi:DJ-1/PfpI family protein [Phenylobacterium sp. SCN 70-31]|uniref:DJ-1/PfpI family protein n=1 Tax=Phenylobacterium sp. SCN 70-31 TaxID=1660129 RepID=UPI000869D3BD|nr:DJ-1/PfpI family protein [Phenylobacterium sp. SCN 70-31]ODT88784.1 MAG: thiamine biosynthesis protein ThiJ [Phenylobacterium sp. SCN 70-31]